MNRKAFELVILSATALCLVGLSACGRVRGNSDIDEVITVSLSDSDASRYRYIPFEVPQNTSSISISYTYDKKDGANKIEIGVFEPAFSGKDGDKKGFRGWSGAVRNSIFLSSKTATHGYIAGKIPPGKWYVIFGAAAVKGGSVDVNLRINFNKIDAAAKKDFDDEEKREFSFDSKPKTARLKTGDLTWFAGDLHSHSFESDGRWSIPGILTSARSNNLDFVSITDHNTFSHHSSIESAAAGYPELLVLNGEEVTTYGGHINVWGLPKGEWIDFRVMPNRAESAAKIAAEAKKLGAIASVNHPTMNCPGCRWTYGDWGVLSAVEVWNGVWDDEDEATLKDWDLKLSSGKRITGIGSSDSHQRPEEPSVYPVNLPIGEPAVFIGAREKSLKGLIEGINAGRVFVAENSRRRMMLSAGDDSVIGDTVEAEFGEIIKFRYSLEGFEKGSKFWLIANAQLAKEYLIYEEDFTGEYNIYAKQDGYVRLEVRSPDNKMLAFSNPIFFRIKK